MKIPWAKKYTLDDLNYAFKDQKSLRESVKILIVDDQPLSFIDSLRSFGYNVTKKDKWDNFLDAEPYDVIVSDIKGVADKFGTVRGEGAFILHHIQRDYPSKGCLVYTSAALSSEYIAMCHGLKLIEKNDDVNDWINSLDEVIAEIKDPKRIWYKIERILEGYSNLSRAYIRQVENNYVKALVKKNGNMDIFGETTIINKFDLNILTHLAEAASKILPILSIQ